MHNTLLTKMAQMRVLASGTDTTTQTILRILAAVFGGSLLTYSFMAALALLLPWPRLDVVYFSTFFPCLVWLGALLWAFSAPTGQRAWRDPLGLTLFFGILALAAAWLR